MAIPKSGWNRDEGELLDNADSSLFACVSFSFFSGSHTTTYKYCFLKCLLDNIFNFDERKRISFKLLSNTFAAIYWNSIVLHAIPVQKRLPKGRLSSIENLISRYIQERPHMSGIPFESIKAEDQESFLRDTEAIFARYVVGAFYEDTEGMLYGFSKKSKSLWLNDKSYRFLIENKEILDQVNYYQWLKEVERILQDSGDHRDNLSTILEEITRRNDLAPFKQKLLGLAEQRTCFYCGKKLTKSAHLDHVIPWSFLKTDSLWNFVFACPHCNESKNDRVPTEDFLLRLIKRNEELGIDSPNILDIANSARINGVKVNWKPGGDKGEA